MAETRAYLLPLTPSAFRRWGQAVLTGGLALLVLILLYLTWAAPELVLFLPVVIAGLAGALVLFRNPEVNLYVVLAAFVAITGQAEGLSIPEVLYGLYFLAFLALWYAVRLYADPVPMLRRAEDVAMGLFLLYVVASVSWAVLFGAKLSAIISEGLVLSLLAFYFPVKEAVARHPRVARRMLLLIGWFGLFVTVRNLLEYRMGLASAEHLWQIVAGRVSENEVLLMLPALGTLTLLLYAQKWRPRILLAGFFLMLFVALILTRSRGYWAAFAVGAAVLFVFTDRQRKVRILLLMAVGLGGGLLVGFLFFREVLVLILGGVIDRFVSLGSAFSDDISLINRFYESGAVWDKIKVNPLLGYGPGTPYQVFDIIEDVTKTKTFIHNGWVGLWYKYGLVGGGLLVFFWVRVVTQGLRLFRMASAPPLLRQIGLVAAVAFLAEALVANTSTPFQMEDAMIMLALGGGLVFGSLEYVQATTPLTPTPDPDDP